MPTHGKFSAWIEVDGIKAHEYKVEERSDGATCYIESKAGQSFKVFARNNYAQTCSGTLSIDGDVLDESFIQCRTLFDIPGERVDKRTIRPFVFKDVTPVDDTPAQQANKIMARLGTIRLSFKRVRFLNDGDKDAPYSPTHWRHSTVAQATLRVGVSQTTTFTCPETSQLRMVSGTKSVAFFQFIYRPREFFEAYLGTHCSIVRMHRLKATMPEHSLVYDTGQEQSHGVEIGIESALAAAEAQGDAGSYNVGTIKMEENGDSVIECANGKVQGNRTTLAETTIKTEDDNNSQDQKTTSTRGGDSAPVNIKTEIKDEPENPDLFTTRVKTEPSEVHTSFKEDEDEAIRLLEEELERRKRRRHDAESESVKKRSRYTTINGDDACGRTRSSS